MNSLLGDDSVLWWAMELARAMIGHDSAGL